MSSALRFTLIEMLAALSIAAVLVYCVYGAISAQAGWRRKGDEIVERGLRFSSLELDFAADLRGLLAPSRPELVSPEQQTSKRLLPDQPSFTERFLDVRGDEHPRPVRFLGTPTTLTLELHGGNPRFDEPTTPRIVVWRCAADRAESVTLFHIGSRPARFDVPNKEQVGIVRWSMSVEHLGAARQSRRLDDLPGDTWNVGPRSGLGVSPTSTARAGRSVGTPTSTGPCPWPSKPAASPPTGILCRHW